MPNKYFNQLSENEISINNIVNLLLQSWRHLIFAGLIGFLCALLFIFVAPKQYEAIAQIKMMQISSDKNSIFGLNIENPNLLIARLKQPSSYHFNEIKACGIEQENSPAELLARIARLSIVNGSDSIVELRILMQSKDQAINCARAVYENIRISQDDIVKPFIEEAKALLIQYQRRLDEKRSIVSRADKSEFNLTAAYLVDLAEIKFLIDESDRLNRLITSVHSRKTNLISSIYASDIPVFPKKKASLLIGLFAGLLVGILFVLVWKTRKV